jgi:hypothetical protein
MKLELNGEVKQDATTAQQIFPVAAVIEFIDRMVTLEPGTSSAPARPRTSARRPAPSKRSVRCSHRLRRRGSAAVGVSGMPDCFPTRAAPISRQRGLPQGVD